MVCMKTLSLYLLSLVLLSCSLPTNATQILALVSPRNAPDTVSGAHQFLNNFPNHTISLRTTDQFNDLTDVQRQTLVRETDILFLGGVFGDSVPALVALIENSMAIDSVVAVHSDRRLVNASKLNGRALLSGVNLDDLMAEPSIDVDTNVWFKEQYKKYPQYQDWLTAKAFWANKETDNIEGLFRHLASLVGTKLDVPLPKIQSPLRVYINGKSVVPEQLNLSGEKDVVAIIDYETSHRPGEKDLIDQLCSNIKSEANLRCLVVLASWGPASVSASALLAKHKTSIASVISLQNFVLGGGDGRADVIANLAKLNVPVLKGIRLNDVTEDEYQVSEEGLHWNSVHYRVAMPELQGISQPLVLSAMSKASIDPQTGVKLASSRPIQAQASLMARKVMRWVRLQNKPNKDKKVAVIYYNHPPGRHNIGADNLNVPNSLLEILRHLKQSGYDTGELPKSREDLLDILQDRGVNLPENRAEIAKMATKIVGVSSAQYQQWFDQLPTVLKDEMQNGPLGYLHASLRIAISLENPKLTQQLTHRVIEDLKHAMEGADHKAKDRVINLLAQLEYVYQATQIDWSKARELVDAIAATDVEGIRGWGKPPGQVMVHDNQLLIPGVQFGNIFVGPQPPRGWELNEEILHANLSFPPTHQYIAFYHWLRHQFNADALVHLGRHSTYEFLPRHRVGMSEADYPTALIDDVPSIYPYIVDGVGEGIQAKRRGLAIIVDHLTPPLESNELYDRLLELRQLVESYETTPEAAGAMRQRAIIAIKDLVSQLQLTDELTQSMQTELEVRGLENYDQVDDELLVHEIGHYLTKLQEDFMPLGLHSFGVDWSNDAIKTMLSSMAQGTENTSTDWETKLSQSPASEMQALEHGLAGKYLAPGKGNDPIRTPEVLPTGRNFYALDGGLIPSRLGYKVGVELARKARTIAGNNESDAVVLWASDVVRDEGAMIAFGLDMLGIKPVWSSRGIVKTLERLDLSKSTENGTPRARRDTIFTTSGLFRDLYGAHIIWLERAVLMALDASSDEIRRQHPALTLALNTALEPLLEQNPGSEPLRLNHVARRWVEDVQQALQQGIAAAPAGREATYRIFGDAPGTYGAGVNRVVERSGSWEKRSEVAAVYLQRMGHAYGAKIQGAPQQALFKQRLNNVGNTYLGRSSNLYGLLDNNDTFDYLGGLSLAVETVKGSIPNNYILAHESNTELSVEPLNTALLSELRGRFLNPQWLEPLMEEGYAGARTMGSEFFEYLWGWQVTNPDIIKSWVWNEVKSVYIDDHHKIGLDKFLEQDHNVHVKSNMLAVMLTAAQKGFWDVDQATLEKIAQQFTQLILQHGLPGSGHTSPSNPIFDYIKEYVSDAQYQAVTELLESARIHNDKQASPSSISELNTTSTTDEDNNQQHQAEQKNTEPFAKVQWLMYVFVLLIIIGGLRGAYAPKTKSKF